MAKNRYVNTHFWSDSYISELDPTEKLLFIYLLTNPFSNIAGVYEITLKQISLDTGIDKEMVLKLLDRFQNDKKIFYFESSWIFIVNFTKHQEQGSDKVQTGIKRIFEELPPKIKKCICDAVKGIPTLPYLIKIIIKIIIKMETEKSEPIDTLPGQSENFIDDLIEIFSVEYRAAKGIEYISQDKDRKAIGQLIVQYKKKQPEANSDKAKNDFKNLFRAACSIRDNNFLAEITLTKLNSHINEYLNKIKNGNKPSTKRFDPATANTWRFS